MAGQIYYNGIELGYIRTTAYKNEPDADSSNPDMKFRVTTLQITSVLALNMIPHSGDATLQALLIRVRHALELPRRAFIYKIGDQEVINIPNGDDNNGPFPFGVSVDLVAEASLVISWGIKVYTADCNNRLSQVLSNRWSESATINDEHLTALNRTGKLVVASRTGVSPDAFRSLVTPKILPKFVRKSSVYTLHENGLELAYQFTDEEQFVMPPFPAIKAEGEMVVATTSETGAKQHGRVTVKLTGPPDVSKSALFARCVEICVSRAMQAGLRKDSNGRFIAGGGITEPLFKNSIGLTMTWLMDPGGKRINSGYQSSLSSGALGMIGIFSNFNGTAGASLVPKDPPKINENGLDVSSLSMRAAWIGLPIPGTGTTYGIAPPTRGDLDWLGLVSAALNDPCLSNALNQRQRPGPPEPSKGINTELVSSRIQVSNQLPPDTVPSAYSNQGDTVYDHYSCVSHYIHDEGIDVAPALKKSVAGKAFRLSAETMRLEVEFSAQRVGKPPVLPSRYPPTASGSNDPQWVYVSGVMSPVNIDLAADGVSLVHKISGVLRFKALNPCKVDVIAPVPPYLALSVQDEARLAAALNSQTTVFLSGARSGTPLNPFCNSFETQRVADGGFGVGQGGGGFLGPVSNSNGTW